jgi:hypothetical protein
MIDTTGFLFWYKKTAIPKMKVFAARNLKDFLPNLPVKSGKARKKFKVFLSRQFYAFLSQVKQ